MNEEDYLFKQEQNSQSLLGKAMIKTDVVIIDAMNVLHTVYHKYKSEELYDFDKIILYLYIQFVSDLIHFNFEDYKKIFFVWDSGNNPYRLNLYPGYKGKIMTDPVKELKRQADFKNIISASAVIKEMLKEIGLSIIERPKTEADDIVPFVCRFVAGEKNYEDISIISSDKDYYQLFNLFPSLKALSPLSLKVRDRDSFIKEYGFDPKKYIIYKCLVGDPSDNIKGVTGIGDKRAKDLMPYFSFDNLEAITFSKSVDGRWATAVRNNWDVLDFNYQLMNLSDYEFPDKDEIRSFIVDQLNESFSNSSAVNKDKCLNLKNDIEKNIGIVNSDISIVFNLYAGG